jgi:hypothetical protein
METALFKLVRNDEKENDMSVVVHKFKDIM